MSKDDEDEIPPGAIATVAEMEQALNQGLAVRKYGPEELDMRRRDAYKMRLRGMTYAEIGEALGVSHVTARNDVEKAKSMAIHDTANYDSKDHVAEMMAAYDDILQTSWEISKSTRDPEVRLKALQEVRKTVNDKQKALMNAGMLGPQNVPTPTTLNIGVIGHWSEANIQEAIQAVLGLQLTTPVLDPEPDTEAELVEEKITKVADVAVQPTAEQQIVTDSEEDDDEYEYED